MLAKNSHKKHCSSAKRRADEILDVAFDLMGREVIDGLSVGKVAQELGLSVGALCRYYASKDELIMGIWAGVLPGEQ